MKRKKLLASGMILLVIGIIIFLMLILFNRNIGMDEERQIRNFADRVAEWNTIYISSSYPYYITIADLNRDGRLELITSTIEGTGRYSQNHYYMIEKKHLI